MLTSEIWEGAILGAVLGSLVIPAALKSVRIIQNWWSWSRPARKLLAAVAEQEEECKIFVRDFMIPKDTPLYSVDPRTGVGIVPNVHHLWPDVEGRAVGDLLNVLGQIGKTDNITIIPMSQDAGEWNANILVLGAQAQKSFDFYRQMKNVAFRMDENAIYDNIANQVVPRESGYGYGIILKAYNPFKSSGRRGVSFLIGGFGALGTAAASYYFKQKFQDLGKEFGTSGFGVVVRASVSAGVQAVERVRKYDRRF